MNACPVCGGELNEIGVLGQRRHHRCRACGAQVSEALSPKVTCAICAEEVEANTVRLEPLGRDGAMVRVCVDCRSDHPRSGRVAAFSGGSADTTNMPRGDGGRRRVPK